MASWIQRFDAVIFNETFSLNHLSLQGFYTFDLPARSHGRGRPFGGVILAIKCLPSTWSHSVSDNCICLVTPYLVIIAVYFNPDFSAADIIDEISQLCSNLPSNSRVFVGGDFNAKYSIPYRPKLQQLISYFASMNLKLCIPAEKWSYECYRSRSLLDFAFSNCEVTKMNTMLASEWSLIRKHKPVNCIVNFHSQILESPTRLCHSRIVNPESLNIQVVLKAYSLMSTGQHHVSADLLTAAIVQSCGSSSSRRFTSRPFNYRKWPILQEMQRTLLRMSRDCSSGHSTKEAYIVLRRVYTKMLQTFHRDRLYAEECHRLSLAESFPWKVHSKHPNKIMSLVPLSKWVDHFRSFLHLDDLSLSLPANNFDFDGSSGLIDTPFSIDEIEGCLARMHVKKASGPDNLCVEQLRATFHIFGSYWTFMFNSLLYGSCLPFSWKEGIVKVLYKGTGPLESPDSYRGIFLLNHVYKLLSFVLTSRLAKHCSSLLPEEQFGFRQGRSTCDAISLVRSSVVNCISNKNSLYAIFIDFRRAFDSVNRNILLSKLHNNCNLRGRFLRLLYQILLPNRVKVFDDLAYSDFFTVNHGVLQGDPISPLLFSIFVIDLPPVIRSFANEVELALYADDLVILTRNLGTAQKALDGLTVFCSRNELDINISKSKVVKFRGGGRLSKHDSLFIKSQTLEFCTNYKYLGVLLTSRWSFTAHLEAKSSKIAIKTASYPQLRKLSFEGALRYFELMLLPIIQYGLATFWEDLTELNFRQIDRCQARFLKHIVGVSNKCSTTAITYLAKIKPLSVRLCSSLRCVQTSSYLQHLVALETKFLNVDHDLANSPVYLQNSWRSPLNVKRPLIWRLSIHGFHDNYCRRLLACHRRDSSCICRFCASSCDALLHALACPHLSLMSLQEINDLRH